MGMYEEIKDSINLNDNVELLKNFMDIQKGYLQMKGELEEANKKIKQLEEKLTLKEKLIYKDNMYYINDGDKLDGPYCSRCYDDKNKLVRMHINRYNYQCPVDGVKVSTEEQRKMEEENERKSSKDSIIRHKCDDVPDF